MPQPPLDDDSSSTDPLRAPPPSAAGGVHVSSSPIGPGPGLRKSTPAIDSLSLSQSESSLPFRKSNPSAASLYASTLSPPGSRPLSPAGRASPSRVLSGSVFDTSSSRPVTEAVGDSPGDPLNLILKAFVPHVSIYGSDDTEAFMKEKGFRNGLWELLRPFGERIQGKVSVRDSNGISRAVDDFSVCFTRFGDNIEEPDPSVSGIKQTKPTQEVQNGNQGSALKDKEVLSNVEAVVDRHLSYAEESFLGTSHHGLPTKQGLDVESASPYYALYLRRLLSNLPIAPHETFAHPVACVIAISSRNESPIDELRRLYAETSQGEERLPPWVDGEYLRYYVLIHDEENDDITRSTGLFEQMKRHLGLHCHLLRLRSSQSAETDDDSIPLPRSDWMSAGEELAEIKRSDDDEDFEDPTRYIFESDATAIRTFVREMVTQSIVPTMERHVSLWNDQVASRRRGIAGRFMTNLSRKWAIGGSSRSSSGKGGSSKESYDTLGFYRADASEAIIRKLADYAFMLRDWRLAQSTYELLRTDFNDAKAWKYHAAANEMSAVSYLLIPQQLSSKNRAETVDQMLESAFYSYGTRCSAPYGAMRSLILCIELLRLRGGSNIDDAGRWGIRLLESGMLGRVGDALIRERIAICYASKEGVGSWNWGSRRRKAAAWSVLAAEAWAQQAKYIPSQRCLNQARKIFTALPNGRAITQFTTANGFMTTLQQALSAKLDEPEDAGDDDDNDGGSRAEGSYGYGSHIDEESEALTDMRARRVSAAVPPGVLETAPLHGEQRGEDDDTAVRTAQQDFD